MIEAAVYDIDNTLTSDVSWLRITELLGGSSAKHQDIFDKFKRDELSYPEAKRQVVDLWQSTGNASKSYWVDVFTDWPLAEGAEELVGYTASKGYRTALITGSFDLFAEAVASKLRIPNWYANTTLVWDEQGRLVDFHYVRDQSAHKLAHLKEFTEKVGVSLDSCVAIGDGDNDVAIFEATGHGIAVNSASTALLAVSWQRVDRLQQIIPILEGQR